MSLAENPNNFMISPLSDALPRWKVTIYTYSTLNDVHLKIAAKKQNYFWKFWFCFFTFVFCIFFTWSSALCHISDTNTNTGASTVNLNYFLIFGFQIQNWKVVKIVEFRTFLNFRNEIRNLNVSMREILCLSSYNIPMKMNITFSSESK